MIVLFEIIDTYKNEMARIIISNCKDGRCDDSVNSC